MKKQGPLLLACNHPNSFLDGVILATLFDYPVYSLARGDVFKKPFYRRLLSALRIMPVYRTSEGVENLGINYETFSTCRKIFDQNGIVFIAVEGKCINEWHLRALKKGTARLAFSSWNENIPLEILPVGINYSSFRRFGKNIFLNFGEIITKNDFDLEDPDGKKFQAFNQTLFEQLQKLVWEIDKNDIEKQKKILEKKPSRVTRMILSVPAAIGWLLHAPLYIPVKVLTIKKTIETDHFDSILMALLLLFYPVYLLLLTVIVVLVTGNPLFYILPFAFVFTAWAYVQVKGQLDEN